MKRFYSEVSLAPEGRLMCVCLDGRPVLTPTGNRLCLPGQAVAEAVAREWSEAGDGMRPHTMPFTRLANTAIDRVASDRAAVVREVSHYVGSDLVCYFSAEPAALRQRQEEVWLPLVAWLKRTQGIALQVTTSILPAAQAPETIRRTESVVAGFGDFSLAGLHLAAAASGSAVIALALAAGRLDASGAWAATLIEELWQAENWGVDEEAEVRRGMLREDLETAAAFLMLCEGA